MAKDGTHRDWLSDVFVKTPWARSMVELKNGRVDIIDGAYKTAKRQRFA
jgi:polar amino acid transport system substrate-binding protein